MIMKIMAVVRILGWNPRLALMDGGRSDAIVPFESDSVENNGRSKKRYIIDDEEANAALQVPNCYQVVHKPPDAEQ